MGMAASQARFLGLTARKTNVEYEGQQINQQRTALGNQTANYYNQMLGMSVPVPPAIDDYTKTIYTFNDGALKNSVTSLIAGNNGQYKVSYLKEWQDDFSIVSATTPILTRISGAGLSAQYNIGATTLRPLGSIPTKPDPFFDGQVAAAEQAKADADSATTIADARTAANDGAAAANAAAGALPAGTINKDTIVGEAAAVDKKIQDVQTIITFIDTAQDTVGAITNIKDYTYDAVSYTAQAILPGYVAGSAESAIRNTSFTDTKNGVTTTTNFATVGDERKFQEAAIENIYKDLISLKVELEGTTWLTSQDGQDWLQSLQTYYLGATNPAVNPNIGGSISAATASGSLGQWVSSYRASNYTANMANYASSLTPTDSLRQKMDELDTLYNNTSPENRGPIQTVYSATSSSLASIQTAIAEMETFYKEMALSSWADGPREEEMIIAAYGAGALPKHKHSDVYASLSNGGAYMASKNAYGNVSTITTANADAEASAITMLREAAADALQVTLDARVAANMANYDGDGDEYWKSMTMQQRMQLLEQEKQYIGMLESTVGASAGGWLVRYTQNTTTGQWVPTFYKADDLAKSTTVYDDHTGNSYSYIPAYTVGSKQKVEEIKNVDARLEQDSTGRLINITLNPGQPDAVTYALTTNTIADQAKYDDAINQYEFAKYQYDQAIQEINAKIAIIQAQDKNLELRLKQLDTEQNAIQTEMDAVSKVIQKNVESTFKTFG